MEKSINKRINSESIKRKQWINLPSMNEWTDQIRNELINESKNLWETLSKNELVIETFKEIENEWVDNVPEYIICYFLESSVNICIRCIHVFVCVCMYVCMYVRMYVHICLCVYMYVLMYDYIYVLFVCRVWLYIHRCKRTGTGD